MVMKLIPRVAPWYWTAVRCGSILTRYASGMARYTAHIEDDPPGREQCKVEVRGAADRTTDVRGEGLEQKTRLIDTGDPEQHLVTAVLVCQHPARGTGGCFDHVPGVIHNRKVCIIIGALIKK